jgi:Protein of unknown function (DUF2793)
MTDTPNLGLPFIEGSQAQKHVTHNEALRILDATIQISVLDTSHTSPPLAPVEGERHVVASGATGAWAGHVNAIATWQDGAWAYLIPHAGWCVWSVADDVMFVFDGTHWRDLRNLTVDNLPRLGVNTTASSPNLFSVKSNAALLAAINAADGGSGDARLQISKESAAKTASVFFSDAFSGRAEFGLAGSDAFRLKVSADGSSWIDAFSIDQTSGNLTLSRGLVLSGVIAPSQITANQNDYNPAGLASAAVIQLSSDAVRSVSGLAGGAEGRVLCLINVGTQPLMLLDQSSSSAAANRFALGSDLTIPAKQAAMLRYDGATSRWQAIAGAAGLLAAANNLSDISSASAARANLGIMFRPQGRLTLQSGVAVMATTQSAKTTLYYTPCAGNQIPLYDGAKMVPSVFAELSAATSDTSKSPAAIGAGKVNDWFVWNDGGTLRLGHGPDWTSDTARSAGTALVMVNGIWLNNASITNGPAAQRGTYVGTTRSDGSSQLNWTFGAAGVPALLHVWNAYNRIAVSTASSEATATWNYTSATIRTPNASLNARISFVSGLAEEAVVVDYVEACNLAAVLNAYCSIGFALDSTTAADKLEQPTNASNAAVLTANVTLPHAYLPQLGAHFVQALEGGDGTNAATFIGGAKMNLRLTTGF